MAAHAARESTRTRYIARLVCLLLVLAAVAGCGSSGGGQTGPSPAVTLTASPAPSQPGVHQLSSGEELALAKVGEIVEHPKTKAHKRLVKGYSTDGMEITGYHVRVRAPGMLIGLLVDASDGSVSLVESPPEMVPREIQDEETVAGESWALRTAQEALETLLDKLSGVGVPEWDIMGYVVGWPKAGPLTLWVDGEGRVYVPAAP